MPRPSAGTTGLEVGPSTVCLLSSDMAEFAMGYASLVREALTVAQHLDSEHFRFTPRTCPSVRWQAELGPKENLHERAGYRGETGLGF